MDPEKEKMRLQLKKLIEDWNSNRVDLFALSEPNSELEFHGVMRFFFQDSGQKVATKCIRVSSTATTRAVIEALIEKFHPDLKMLTSPSYSLWEVHESGGERKLALDEKPLLVQLNWHKDDREGRFLLKREDETISASVLRAAENDQQMKRKLSKREKKEAKRREKEIRVKEAEDVASKLYAEVPNTNFTRTISNPEIVMKKRRERKLEQKLKDMGEGGSLKIYGEELSESKPYVTLLVSIKDRAEKVVRETLEKYGLDWHDPSEYCLVEVRAPVDDQIRNVTPIERVLDDDDRPLLLLANEGMKGAITFHVRRKSAEMLRLKRQRSRPSTTSEQETRNGDGHRLPQVSARLVELNEDNGGGFVPTQKVITIRPNVTEVGNDSSLETAPNGIHISGANVHPRHCVIAFMDGVVTITPCSSNAEILVNEKQIVETTILRNGNLLRIGRTNLFRFAVSDPSDVRRFSENESNLESRNGKPIPNDSYSVPNRSLISSVINRAFTVRSNRRSASSAIYETTFDVDGGVETLSSSSNFAIADSVLIVPPDVVQMKQTNPATTPPSVARPTTLLGRDTIPAIIELLDDVEQEFITTIIRDIQTERVNFKLAPAYIVYMCCRYRISPHYRVGASPDERGRRLAEFLTKLTNFMHITIQDHCHDANALAFWMANSSEILNFLKLDNELRRYTSPEPQESLADAVQKAFDHLSACFKQDLHASMPFMLELNVDDQTSTNQCLQMLSGAMSVLRVCRMNAALTIQIFSQLFHYINMYLFNWLVSREGGSYCCRTWGIRLSRRLSFIQMWAEKQGLELAAECRLERVLQASKLLQASKTIDNLAPLIASCPKLNSFQLRSLLERYRPEVGESPVAHELIENMVKISESQVDETLKAEGQFVHVEEDLDLQLPFLLPDDGYSPDVIRGLAPGLKDFVETLLQRGLCRMILQPSSSGLWTVHMGVSIDGHQPIMPRAGQPEIATISFEKGNGGIGLSIVQAQGQGQREPGIYIKKVVANSAAFRDGRLQSGDQLLKVNGHNLIGISQDQAAQYMAKSGAVVTFEVAKGAALYNGLATWIYASSDVESPMRPLPSSMSADGRFRSAEHLPPPANQRLVGGANHVSPQQYGTADTQPPTTHMVGHVRYPSSSSLHQTQPSHQMVGHPSGYSNAVPSSSRSMSTTNLDDDIRMQQQRRQSSNQQHQQQQAPPPVLPPSSQRPHLNAYRQQMPSSTTHDENYYQNISQFHQQQPTSAKPIYYANNDGLISNYNARSSVTSATPVVFDASPVANKHNGVQQQQQLNSAHPSAYTNEEYHHLPQYPSTNQRQAHITSSPRMPGDTYVYHNNAAPPYQNGGMTKPFYVDNASVKSLSATTTPISNEVFAFPSPHHVAASRPISATFQNTPHTIDTTSTPVEFQRRPTSQALVYSNGHVNGGGDASKHVYANGGTSIQQQRHTSSVAPYATVQVPAAENGLMHGCSNISTSTSSYATDESLMTISSNSQMRQITNYHQQVPPPHQQQMHRQPDQSSLDGRRMSGASSTTSSSKISPPTTTHVVHHQHHHVSGPVSQFEPLDEENVKQIESEVERLLCEEIDRLEAKEFLTAVEQKRYQALRYEYEYRRRLRNADDENGGESEMMISSERGESRKEEEMRANTAQRVYDDAMEKQQRLQQLDKDMERERMANEMERQDKLERRLEILDDSSLKRQHMRQQYFDDAEKKLMQETVVRQRQKLEMEQMEMERLAESEFQRKILEERLDEETGRLANELNAQRLSSQMRNVVIDEKTNGRATKNEQQQQQQQQHESVRQQKPQPPEVPPKRRVQFDETPPTPIVDVNDVSAANGNGRRSSSSFTPSPPPPVWMNPPEKVQTILSSPAATIEAPKKYVYQNTEAELPRTQVIGAQEVYRDPRQERLRMQTSHPKSSVEGEKLSFKDKMRLFAKEVGEQTPKEKVKASSKQLEIEHSMNISTVS